MMAATADVSRAGAPATGGCALRRAPLGAPPLPCDHKSGRTRSKGPDATRPAVPCGRDSRTRHPAVVWKRTSWTPALGSATRACS